MSNSQNISGGRAPSFIESQGTLFGHPKGLMILFFTEMWERFSYYGMRGILVLFLVSTTNGGYGWNNEEALELYGTYTMFVYLMSIPGGILADKVLGQKKAVIIGGFTLVAGHLLMAYPPEWAFYTALCLIVAGTGLLKPNISTMVGGLYREGDSRRDSGFTIFYMGINLGALLASLIVGYVGEVYGWHYGFSLAGFGMILGQVVFIWGRKYLKGIGDLVKSDKKKDIIFTKNEAVASAGFLGFNRQEWDRIIVILISFIIVLVFWASFEQAGGLMNLYALQYTDRFVFGWEVPTAWLQGLNSFFILTFGGVVASVWIALAKRGKNPPSIFKMGLGTAILGVGFIFMVFASLQRNSSPDGLSSLHWLVFAYMFHTLGELALSPVSLSFITKVAPKRIVASMMGLYFAVTGLGNKLASLIGIWAQRLGELEIFMAIAGFTIILGIILMLLTRKINNLTHGMEDKNEGEEEAQTGQLLEAEI
ncbi:peptide MFS transporter [Pontibacter silvestris]|uniref:Peptide MFS transporter n=1 Tax=Pontibacter silvestris TaxID=2305183 RepID=A0ABW4X1L3_9BACT|nr:peptide MFS transporter [Pontibacter silvestris]MCC9138231.1 peptide MFS transporter [Pontibacter silvestris]